MITGKNYIGEELSAKGGVIFETFNPQTNANNDWRCYEADESEVNQALALSWEAFREYRSLAPENRAAFLNAIAEEIENLGDELIETYCSESGLPKGRAEGERGRTVFQLRSFAEMLQNDEWKSTSFDEANPNRQPLPKSDIRKTSIPLGPVAVFGSSNFPLAYSTAGGDTASALAAGCPVVVKSHPMHAGTGELIASAIIKAAKRTNMPNGVFSNLNSSGIEVGVQIVKDSRIKAVGFTGSIRGGRALYNLAATREEPIPVFAEMGSINPVVISSKSLKLKGDEWVEKYAGSITLAAGQFCTNPGLILGIEGEELDAFIEKLSTEIVRREASCMLHPNIKGAYETLNEGMITNNYVTRTSASQTVEPNYGEHIVATTTGQAFLENSNLHSEVFGPFSLIVKCKNLEELISVINGLEGQLTGTIVCEQDEILGMTDVVDALQYRVGRVIFNGVPTGVEVCPSMNHGGPYPASSDSRFTAVGIHSVQRWIRPVSFQDFPQELLPTELKNG